MLNFFLPKLHNIIMQYGFTVRPVWQPFGTGFTPIDFILPVLLWNKAKNPPFLQRAFHWLIAIVYGLVAVAGISETYF